MTMTGAGAATSARMPASLPLPPASTSLGHFRPARTPVDVRNGIHHSHTGRQRQPSPCFAGNVVDIDPDRHRDLCARDVRPTSATAAAAGRLVFSNQHGPADVFPGGRTGNQIGVGGTGFVDHLQMAPGWDQPVTQ